ncbi:MULTISPECIES: AraC family transcriptional regulator [Bradyrhizobium]|uniref:AraC family transcriptional regulator n=1 Tax=Bradyrhizobium TaxID=374 RepID=UPI001FEFFEA8|nr:MULTISPECIES: AraC family transcriptional regulator [Bradyrhizobium]
MNEIDQPMSKDLQEEQEFWRHPRFRDLGLLKAKFTKHRYDRHTHPNYVIALITAGAERVKIGRETVVAPTGTLLVVNPEEWHDGESGCPDGWSYRTFYPQVEFLTHVAVELGRSESPIFRQSAIDDPQLRDAMALAHRLSRSDDILAAETAMLVSLRHLILRHTHPQSPPEFVEHSNARRRMAVYQELVEKRLCFSIDLQQLAAAAGVTRFQVIRDFKKVAGLTPAAFIRDRRLRRANALIEAGASLADAAVGAGFADQSHLSRIFRAAHGFTPGMLKRAVA